MTFLSILPRLISVLLMLASLVASQPHAREPQGNPPAISVETGGGVTLLYDMGLNMWNGAIYDRTPTDAFFYMRQSGMSIPFVPLGETICITFDGDPPDGWTLYDRIDGTRRGEQILDIDFIGNTAIFTLEAFPDDLTHAVITEHDLPPDLRTFMLVCGWGGNVCEYAFGFSTGQ